MRDDSIVNKTLNANYQRDLQVHGVLSCFYFSCVVGVSITTITSDVYPLYEGYFLSKLPIDTQQNRFYILFGMSTNVVGDEDANSNKRSMPQLPRDQIENNGKNQMMAIHQTTTQNQQQQQRQQQ
jgi:hypothetical protein